MSLTGDLLPYLVSFFAILFGAGLIVKSVDKFANKLRLSSFSVSFFVLGLLTSIPEFAVGLTAVNEGTPEIFVGNLIGGVAVLFFLVIPFLSIFGNGVRLNHQMGQGRLTFAFAVMILPLISVLDGRITNIEGIALIAAYLILFFVIERDKGVFDDGNKKVLNVHSYSFVDIMKILFGVFLVFVSSHVIVEKTILFAAQFNISTFYISLLMLAIGTNLPEISLAVKSVAFRKKDIAFGDYIGSAATNTLLFGVFTMLSKGDVLTSTHFTRTFILIVAGLALFYYFTRSKKDISRREGFILAAYYVFFIVMEGI
jgi:cation:H+ antiporter